MVQFSRILISSGVCFPVEQIQNVQDSGAIGFIVGRTDNWGGLGSLYLGEKSERKISFTVVEISISDSNKLKELLESFEIDVIIEPGMLPNLYNLLAHNPYADLPLPLFPVIFLLFSAANITMASYKLFYFILRLQLKRHRCVKLLKMAKDSSPIIILIEEIEHK